jgi:hypothetical protein
VPQTLIYNHPPTTLCPKDVLRASCKLFSSLSCLRDILRGLRDFVLRVFRDFVFRGLRDFVLRPCLRRNLFGRLGPSKTFDK